jgi:hypothetical protein
MYSISERINHLISSRKQENDSIYTFHTFFTVCTRDSRSLGQKVSKSNGKVLKEKNKPLLERRGTTKRKRQDCLQSGAEI